MDGLLLALSRYTVLRTDVGTMNLRKDATSSGLWWLPVIGILIGAFASSFYHPLGTTLLPADVALVLALGWQAFLGGFHAESGFVSMWRRPTAGMAALFFVLLLKFVLFRQWYPDAVWRVMLLSSVTSFCAPVMLLGRLEGAEAPAGWAISRRLLSLTWVFWLVAVLFLAVPSVRSGLSFTLLDHGRATSSVIVFTLVAQLFVAGHLRTRGVKETADGVFAGALVIDLAACVGLVSAAHLFL